MNENKLNSSDIKNIFLPLGFKARTVMGQQMYEYDGIYYHLDYISKDYGYAIETAESIEDIKCHRMEDSATVSLGGSKEETINNVVECLKEYFI